MHTAIRTTWDRRTVRNRQPGIWEEEASGCGASIENHIEVTCLSNIIAECKEQSRMKNKGNNAYVLKSNLIFFFEFFIYNFFGIFINIDIENVH